MEDVLVMDELLDDDGKLVYWFTLFFSGGEVTFLVTVVIRGRTM